MSFYVIVGIHDHRIHFMGQCRSSEPNKLFSHMVMCEGTRQPTDQQPSVSYLYASVGCFR